jgi:hypothetical protein
METLGTDLSPSARFWWRRTLRRSAAKLPPAMGVNRCRGMSTRERRTLTCGFRHPPTWASSGGGRPEVSEATDSGDSGLLLMEKEAGK